MSSDRENAWLCIAAALVALWAVVWLYRDSLEIEHIADKYVFVTGCDSGFGNLLCRKLDRRGFHVLAGCLTEKGADDLRKAAGPCLKTVLLDVTNQDSIQKAMEWTKKEVGEKGERTEDDSVNVICEMIPLTKAVFFTCRSVGSCEQCWALITHGS